MWEPIEDIYEGQQAKTSPIHKPEFEYEMDLVAESPMSTPSNLNHGFSNRSADIPVDDAKMEDFVKKYEEIVSKKKTQLKQKKKVPVFFTPFISFEATEITVQQLRSLCL